MLACNFHTRFLSKCKGKLQDESIPIGCISTVAVASTPRRGRLSLTPGYFTPDYPTCLDTLPPAILPLDTLPLDTLLPDTLPQDTLSPGYPTPQDTPPHTLAPKYLTPWYSTHRFSNPWKGHSTKIPYLPLHPWIDRSLWKPKYLAISISSCAEWIALCLK